MHDEPPTAAGQARRGDGDVDAHRVRDQREVGAQVADVGTGDVELDGRHRVAREPPDAVDVGAVLGDRGRRRRRPGASRSGAPMHDDRGPPGARAARCHRWPTSRSTRMPEPVGRPRQPVDEHVLVAAGGAAAPTARGGRARRPARGRAPRRRPSRPPRTAPWSRPGRSGPLRRDEEGSRRSPGQGRGAGGRHRIGAGGTPRAGSPSVDLVPPRDEVAHRTEVVVRAAQADREQPGADVVQRLGAGRRSRRRPRAGAPAWRTTPADRSISRGVAARSGAPLVEHARACARSSRACRSRARCRRARRRCAASSSRRHRRSAPGCRGSAAG